MTKLEQLIEELCPNGVEFKKVKDVFQRLKGTPITAGKMKEIENPNGEIKVFAGGKTVINANEADIPNANITRVPAVLVQSRGVIDVVYYEKPFTFKNEMWAYTTDNKTTVKYLYYVLKNNIQHFRDAASGMGSLPKTLCLLQRNFIFRFPLCLCRVKLSVFWTISQSLQRSLQRSLQQEQTNTNTINKNCYHLMLIHRTLPYKKWLTFTILCIKPLNTQAMGSVCLEYKM